MLGFRRNITLGASLVLAGLCSTAQAGPPWNVDDPGTTGFRRFVGYASYISTRRRSHHVDAIPSLAITYGLTERTEIGFGFGALTSSTANGPSVYGFADTAFSAKHRFWEKDATQVAVAYQATFPTGNHRVGLSSGSIDQSLWLTGSRQFGHWVVFANLGYAVPGDQSHTDSTFYGLVALCAIGERSRIGFQVFGNHSNRRGDQDELAGGVGLTHDIHDDLQFQAQIGKSFKGRSDLNLYVGFTFAFGGGQ